MLISLADSITILSFSLSSPSMNIIDIDLFASFFKNRKCDKLVSWKSNSMQYAIYALTLDWSKFTMSFIFSPIQFVGLSHPESCQRVQPEHSYSFFSSLDDSTMVFSRLQMLIKRDPQIASSASNSQSSTRRRPETGFFFGLI